MALEFKTDGTGIPGQELVQEINNKADNKDVVELLNDIPYRHYSKYGGLKFIETKQSIEHDDNYVYNVENFSSLISSDGCEHTVGGGFLGVLPNEIDGCKYLVAIQRRNQSDENTELFRTAKASGCIHFILSNKDASEIKTIQKIDYNSYHGCISLIYDPISNSVCWRECVYTSTSAWKQGNLIIYTMDNLLNGGEPKYSTTTPKMSGSYLFTTSTVFYDNKIVFVSGGVLYTYYLLGDNTAISQQLNLNVSSYDSVVLKSNDIICYSRLTPSDGAIRLINGFDCIKDNILENVEQEKFEYWYLGEHCCSLFGNTDTLIECSLPMITNSLKFDCLYPYKNFPNTSYVLNRNMEFKKLSNFKFNGLDVITTKITTSANFGAIATDGDFILGIISESAYSSEIKSKDVVFLCLLDIVTSEILWVVPFFNCFGLQSNELFATLDSENFTFSLNYENGTTDTYQIIFSEEIGW